MKHSVRTLLTMLLCAAVAAVIASCRGHLSDPAGKEANVSRSTTVEPPPAIREFRGAWVATVGNIDWPSKPGLSTEQQQREIIRTLDRAAELNLNAIILQIRTNADAFYDSRLEPWSAYLTGIQGRAPDPFYDPLKFWIEQAHQRGIELHAWFNPFRTGSGAKYVDSDQHISKTHPEWIRPFGKLRWLDPGEPAAQEHSFAVIMDVVDRYDVDGIHIDDYFYPYPELAHPDDRNDKTLMPFPDDATYAAYQKSGGKLVRDDWRRANIDHFVQRLYDGIKQRKKTVKFGISPFGIPRPGLDGIEYVRGLDAYKSIYADASKWLREGWCDYMAPQLYWKTGAPQQPYLGLLEWWTEHNPKHRHIFGGLFTSQINFTDKSWSPDEILGQIMITRLTHGAQGNVQFSMTSLDQNRHGIAEQLRDGPYAHPALPPASGWLDSTAPGAPRDVKIERVTGDAAKPIAAGTNGAAPAATAPFVPLAEHSSEVPRLRVRWTASEPTWLYTVYYGSGAEWKMKIVPGSQNETTIRADATEPITNLAVAAVDRSDNESKRVTMDVPPEK